MINVPSNQHSMIVSQRGGRKFEGFEKALYTEVGKL